MASLEAIREEWRRSVRLQPVHQSMTFTENGLVLGAGTVLAKADLGRFDRPETPLNEAEVRMVALLAAAYGATVSRSALDHIWRASDQWGCGETCLASIHLAYTGLPKLEDPEEASFRLFLADRALTDGVTPRELLKACGVDPESVDLLKARFNPAQPRVPAGHGLESGRWAGSDAPAPAALPTKLPIGFVTYEPAQPRELGHEQYGPELAEYKPEHEVPDDAIAVATPDGSTIYDKDSPTKTLTAPPHANFREIYTAGRAIALLPYSEQYRRAHVAIAQEGTYDFQRDVAQQKFFDAYVHASNYAVGVYMAGAGYSLEATRTLAKLYALRNSKNYNSQDQLNWIKRGWKDGKAGVWK